MTHSSGFSDEGLKLLGEFDGEYGLTSKINYKVYPKYILLTNCDFLNPSYESTITLTKELILKLADLIREDKL